MSSALILPESIATRISTARGPAVAARVGIALGVSITLCFLTGLISHWIQHPPTWFYWPANPVWLYRFTQGAHVISGVIAMPLLLVKLWAVYPRLFGRPLIGNPVRMLERGSIALLVGSVIFQLVTGLFNTAQFYPWKFFFTTTHYAMAYVAAGALAIHLAVKLPIVHTALSRPVVAPPESESAGQPDPEGAHRPEGEVAQQQPGTPVASTGISRRAVLSTAGIAAVVAGLAVAGQTVPFLRWISVLAPRSGQGPQGVPVNRSAADAGVETTARDPAYRLEVRVGGRQREFTRADLAALPQTAAELPIACVEGWSAEARWTGVRLRDLLAAVGEFHGGDVRFESLESGGLYRTSVLPSRHAIDAATLVALRLNGEDLTVDHGYPCRLIAPNRPGVLQTKWLSSIEVLS
ncbi:molybdopterin-dependent oxidoreductase [Nocardia sp. NBC_01503]|uniref:molybdopterin-dependent oxidoreductase n=1 Tax=Nocardia sp. NBC_01503 TaxID=2975997 RepID=UPI002E7BC878|nr:molybdopterin-dependent oxidoreductase [Nocardia sp. NBC_01503]WTL36564.1 molybdopterin-dependent oxidoreductase [Nocardia sp. NBC_01503]